MKNQISFEEIIKAFEDPRALDKIHKMWGEAEPRKMKEVYRRIPSLPLFRKR